MLTDIAKLTESPGALKRRPDGAQYHDGETIISHLNYALEPWGWDWAELDSGIDTDTDEAWVLGQLTARFVVAGPDGAEELRTTTKIERGWQKINRLRDGSAKSPGDDRKGAATDALKRCARLLGVGLDAWSKARDEARGTRREGRPDPRPADPVPVEPLSKTARSDAAARYVDLLAQAQAAGFRASWTSVDPASWSDIQLGKYSGLLEQHLARWAGTA